MHLSSKKGKGNVFGNLINVYLVSSKKNMFEHLRIDQMIAMCSDAENKPKWISKYTCSDKRPKIWIQNISLVIKYLNIKIVVFITKIGKEWLEPITLFTLIIGWKWSIKLLSKYILAKGFFGFSSKTKAILCYFDPF